MYTNIRNVNLSRHDNKFDNNFINIVVNTNKHSTGILHDNYTGEIPKLLINA